MEFDGAFRWIGLYPRGPFAVLWRLVPSLPGHGNGDDTDWIHHGANTLATGGGGRPESTVFSRRRQADRGERGQRLSQRQAPGLLSTTGLRKLRRDSKHRSVDRT